MSVKTQSISLSKLIAHPDNPNVMSEVKFNKLVRNIERTGLYEPIVVRPHPKKKGRFQIINGHHRVKALEKIGKSQADCVVWNVDDEQTAVLLTTLNRLCGSDEPAKKIEILNRLKERFGSLELSKLVPQTRKQIEQLTNLKLSAIPLKPAGEAFALPLVFFVTKPQQELIENAIETAVGATLVVALRAGTPDNEIRGRARPAPTPKADVPQTRAQHRASAIASIAQEYLNAKGAGK